MQDELRFIIDENLVLVLHKGPAGPADLHGHSGAKHHDLFVLGSLFEDLLDLLSHVFVNLGELG